MKITNKVTLRYMKLNKKRSIVTVIGVVLSAVLFTSVFTVGTSFLNLFRENAKVSYGDWHYMLQGISDEQLETVKNDSSTQSTSVINYVTLSHDISDDDEEGNELFMMAEVDKELLNSEGFSLKEGRLPQNSSEVAIDYELIKGLNIKVGDTIDEQYSNDVDVQFGYSSYGASYGLDPEKAEHKKFKVVGTVNRTPNYYRSSFYTARDENSIIKGENDTVFVKVNNINGSITSTANRVADSIDYFDIQYNTETEEYLKPDIIFNDMLLLTYGVTVNLNAKISMSIILIFLVALVGIVMLGSVMLIHNSIAISVSEKLKTYGILASIGATKKQRRSSVLLEALVLGVIGIPLGVLAGIGASQILILIINPHIESIFASYESFGGFHPLTLSVEWWALIIAIFFSALTILVSALTPARKASKISPISSIRQSTETKIEKKKIKTSKLTKKLFGIEGTIALKNLKRNKRRYRTTITSMAMSIVLFLVVSYILNIISYESEGMLKNSEYILLYSGQTDSTEKSLDQIRNMDHVEKAGASQSRSWLYFSIKNTTKEFQDAQPYDLYKSDDPALADFTDITICSLDDKTLKEYADKVGADYNKLKDSSELSGILYNCQSLYMSDSTTDKDGYDFSVENFNPVALDDGERLEVYEFNEKCTFEYDWDETGYYQSGYSEGSPLIKSTVGNIKIEKKTTQQPPYGLTYGNTIFIVSTDTYSKLMENMDNNYIENFMTVNKDMDKARLDEAAKELMDENKENPEQSEIYICAPYEHTESIKEEIEGKIPSVELWTDFSESFKTTQNIISIVNLLVYSFIIVLTLVCVANIFNTISTSMLLRRRELAALKSIGMTKKEFNRMIIYESIFYGLKSLLYGLPASAVFITLLLCTANSSDTFFELLSLFPWVHLVIAIVSVFVISLSATFYSLRMTKKFNIVETLKEDS